MRIGLACLLAVAALASPAAAGEAGAETAIPKTAGLRLPRVFSDNMVLQRDVVVPIWGTAAAGEEITARIGGQELKAKADEKGQWSLKLSAMKAGGPHEMTVAGKSTVTFKNVAVGEVWFCSGQSNMDMALSHAATAKEALVEANRPDIRLLNGSDAPWVQQGSWMVCDTANAREFSGVAFFFGREVQEKLKIPVGLIASAHGGTQIHQWMSAVGYEGLAGIGKAADGGHYKGKIRPLVPYAIRGAIWFQGENDVGNSEFYGRKMEALIGGWRKVWGQGDFPFYFVQLSPHAGYRPQDALPRFWEEQTKALAIPNTGMVVITDVGGDVHVRRQDVVGHRLALLALNKTYGHNKLVCSGPIYKSMAVQDGKVRLKFDEVGGGLASRDGKPLNLFEIACEDRSFVPAEAEIDGESVVVSAKGLVKPVAVRFGWCNSARPNLINKEGLPASPFRTDHW